MIHPLDANAIVDLISYTILFYDYLLTFGAEVERFWKRPSFSWAFFLFFVNRYLNILGHIPVVAKAFWSSNSALSETSHPALKLYHDFQRYNQFVMIAVQLVGGVVMIMRVYALYDQNWPLLYSLLVTAAAVIIVGCWAILSKSSMTLPATSLAVTGCDSGLTSEQALRLAAAWGGQLGFDVIIFALTLRKSWCIGPVGERALIDIVLRDGTLYFAIMTLANVGNIATLLLADPTSKGAGSTITNIISGTMISRLMLNLRDPKITATKSFPKLTNADNGLPLFVTTNVVSADAPLSVYAVEADILSSRRTTQDERTVGARESGRWYFSTL
ncbi:hypothetical protein BV22DRAFT_1129445 [Leucogyrophana mollusca]|uniref:Uncharacterized protein n=1 Tax=Leucogyrophana mollusca TaxID=85980 RepID=A0ACB8BH96_9AGAM|nr:hypothetical protein BV22DRAFT_1129445 [Leucogyrophana mollusca]